MPTSVRLDAKTEALLLRAMRKTGLAKSEIIRRAVAAYVATGPRNAAPMTPYETMAHLIGRVRGGPPDLSERTGEKLRTLMAQRSRRS